MQFGEVPADSEFSGILSKKKLDHGRFEDPYRSKVQCWVFQGFFHILPMTNVSDVRSTVEVEKIEISKCQVNLRLGCSQSFISALLCLM
jgi:hypothetical protein